MINGNNPKNAEFMVAKALSDKFLSEGNFELAGGAVAAQTTASPASAGTFDYHGFEGLSVQAVGFAHNSLDVALEGVHIFVTIGSKKSLKEMPSNVNGTPIHIHNTGKVVVRSEAAAATTRQGKTFERGDRIACGSSCGPAGCGYAGTVGALAKKTGSNELFALSNNHVFADCNHTPVGMPIMSPSEIDAKPNSRAPQMICIHDSIVELRSGVPTLVDPCHSDLAIAKVPKMNAVSSWQGDDNGYDTPVNVLSPRSGQKVKKFGRTTGLTFGTILAEDLKFSLPYAAKHFSALVWFNEVWTIKSNDSQPFALGGDSGSLVVTDDAKAAVGIVFAISPRGEFAYVIPIDRVISAFGGLTLVGNHGI